MKNLFVAIIGVLCLVSFHSYSQVINSAGDWDDSGIWNGANIADDISENPSFDNSLGTITIRATYNYTVGALSMNNGNVLTIDATGSLAVGASGNAKDFSTGNTATLNVDGDLTIWGDLSVGNNLILNVTGTLTIKGNLDMGNGGDLTVAGNVIVEGNFQGGNNTALDVDGSIAVSGDFDVGNGSTATGTGSVAVGGTCTDDPVGICTSGPLPISLLGFALSSKDSKVLLNWATATEVNFDYFSIERSSDGLNFEVIGTVTGNGNSQERIDYSYSDNNPLLGLSYYRLTATDLDGSFEVFDIVGIKYNGSLEARVFPNPVSSSQLQITLNQFAEGSKVMLHNLSGKLILDLELASISTEIDLPENIENGIYLVTVQNTLMSERHRVVLNR